MGKLGRRTFVVDRSFQMKYTLMLALTGAIISAVFGVLMYLAHIEARKTVETYRALVPSSWLRVQLSQGEATMLWLVVGVTVMMAAALGLFGVLITHRVAGPIYVMTHYMSVLAQGRYPKMRPLRKNDELKAFFERFQTAVETLRAQDADDAEKIRAAMQALAGVSLPAEARTALDALKPVQERRAHALAAAPAAAAPAKV